MCWTENCWSKREGSSQPAAEVDRERHPDQSGGHRRRHNTCLEKHPAIHRIGMRFDHLSVLLDLPVAFPTVVHQMELDPFGLERSRPVRRTRSWSYGVIR